MAVKLSDEVKITILIQNEEVHAVFPGYGDKEMQEAIKKLLSSRFTAGRGGRAQDKSMDARIRFFNTMCLRVENVELPDGTPLLSTVENWRAEVPVNWKVSFALPFEEQNTLTEEEEGN
jgi:hypothetical protein|tara:strand:- start:1967 stop:2323 length:357 start_codon:yes stop_codon:yes gene_type:complete